MHPRGLRGCIFLLLHLCRPPQVKLTRSRDGQNGVATFLFDAPSFFNLDKEEDVPQDFITAMKMIDEEGVISTPKVCARFTKKILSLFQRSAHASSTVSRRPLRRESRCTHLPNGTAFYALWVATYVLCRRYTCRNSQLFTGRSERPGIQQGVETALCLTAFVIVSPLK